MKYRLTDPFCLFYLKHVKDNRDATTFGDVTTRESLWIVPGTETERGMQIDLIIDRDDRKICLCIYQARNWFKVGTGGLFISLLGLRPGLLNVTRLQALFYEAFQHFSHGFQKSVGRLRSKNSIEVESSLRTRNCYSGVTGGTGTL